MEGMIYVILHFIFFKFVCSLKEQLTPTDITGITHTCPNRVFTSSFADTYGQCLQHCWMTTGCSASTWIPRSSVCRLHEDGYSLPPQTPENTSCLFTEVSTSHLSKHHPCEGRPCDAGQTCVAVEAASNFICLSAPVPATTSTTATTTTTTTTTTTSTTTTTPTTTSSTTTQSLCKYMGCYLDDSNRMIKDIWVQSEVMTLEWCMAKCREGNHKFAGLEFYQHCFCGDSYDVSRYPQKEESGCNTPCRGNPQQMCGGGWRLSMFLCR